MTILWYILICIIFLGCYLFILNREPEPIYNISYVTIPPWENIILRQLGDEFNVIDIDYCNDNNDYDETDVHDHAIQNSIGSSYDKLIEWKNSHPSEQIPKEDVIKSIKMAIFNSTKSDNLTVSERAYSTLKAIHKNDASIHTLGKLSQDYKISDILQCIWSRIHAPANVAVKDELIAHLIEQLADANTDIDRDLTRCPTGVASRIIQSLESLDAEHIVNITSTSVINRELQDKVPHLINLYQRNWTEDQIKKYNNGDDILSSELRNHVNQVLKSDYLDSELLTPYMYDLMVKDYLNAI